MNEGNIEAFRPTDKVLTREEKLAQAFLGAEEYFGVPLDSNQKKELESYLEAVEIRDSEVLEAKTEFESKLKVISAKLAIAYKKWRSAAPEAPDESR